MSLNFQTLKNLIASNSYQLAGFAGLASFFYLTKRFYFDGGSCPDKTTKLNGTVVIITGANTGIIYFSFYIHLASFKTIILIKGLVKRLHLIWLKEAQE